MAINVGIEYIKIFIGFFYRSHTISEINLVSMKTEYSQNEL